MTLKIIPCIVGVLVIAIYTRLYEVPHKKASLTLFNHYH